MDEEEIINQILYLRDLKGPDKSIHHCPFIPYVDCAECVYLFPEWAKKYTDSNSRVIDVQCPCNTIGEEAVMKTLEEKFGI